MPEHKRRLMKVNGFKILVAISGTNKVDEEVIKIACKLTKGNKGKSYVVHVIEVKRSLPLDAEPGAEIGKGEKVLDRAENIAEGLGYEVETELLQARDVGPAIVDEAIQSGVNLIVLGIEYRKPLGEFSLGNTVPYVLKNAPCPVLLYREHPPKEANAVK
jgi:nucleotide-binding universal stress UspA family protein